MAWLTHILSLKYSDKIRLRSIITRDSIMVMTRMLRMIRSQMRGINQVRVRVKTGSMWVAVWAKSAISSSLSPRNQFSRSKTYKKWKRKRSPIRWLKCLVKPYHRKFSRSWVCYRSTSCCNTGEIRVKRVKPRTSTGTTWLKMRAMWIPRRRETNEVRMRR